MEYALAGILLIFVVFLFYETRRKSQRIQWAVTEVKRAISEDSGMTATIGVFVPDTQTTVVIAASEQLGSFYYRMLRQTRVIIKSRINLANLSRIEFLLNGQVHPITINSQQLTLSLCATEVADHTLAEFSADVIRSLERAALRVIFYDEAGIEKTLEITSFRASDERQRFERVQLIKNTVWWVAYLQMASRQSRRIRASLDGDQSEDE